MVTEKKSETLEVCSSSWHLMSDKLPTQFYSTIDEFVLESGEIIVDATVAFTVKGRLDAARSNVVVICHALSGSADFEDWWSLLLTGHEEPALDPNRFCIIWCNCLGSPYGSSSPVSSKPGSNNSFYGPDFPKTTIRDDVRIQKYVLDRLGVRSVHSVIGASMGGMLALEWSFFGGEYVRSLILIATTARQSPWAIAWAENQRATIKADAKYREGFYGDDPPVAGLGAARMSAMLSYRTHKSFENRFGRLRLEAKSVEEARPGDGVVPSTSLPLEGITLSSHSRNKQAIFAAQSYLRYQADKFNSRFDTNCYLHLLDKIDTHDITRGRYESLSDDDAMDAVLGHIQQPALVVGIPTDVLYPLSEQLALAKGLPKATFHALESEDGHDGFLLEGKKLNYILKPFLS